MGSRANRKMRKELQQKQEMRDFIQERASIATETEIKMPDDDKVVLKKVPAMVDGVEIGEAVLFDDGTSTVILKPDEEIPDNIKEKLKGVVVAFNQETGANFTIEEVLGRGF